MTKKELISSVAISALAAGFVAFPVFAEGPVDIKIVEKVDDGTGNYKDWEDITGAMPGMTYSAIPRVKNTGEVPVEVRMCLSESATNATGDEISLPVNTFGISINGDWSLDNEGVTNTSDPASGNCYRYGSMLEVGAVTEPIFTEVVLSPALGNEYQGATFNLHLDAYAAGDELPEDEEATPGNPDTGGVTKSEPLTTGGYVALSLGAAVLLSMISYLVARSLRKK